MIPPTPFFFFPGPRPPRRIFSPLRFSPFLLTGMPAAVHLRHVKMYQRLVFRFFRPVTPLFFFVPPAIPPPFVKTVLQPLCVAAYQVFLPDLEGPFLRVSPWNVCFPLPSLNGPSAGFQPCRLAVPNFCRVKLSPFGDSDPNVFFFGSSAQKSPVRLAPLPSGIWRVCYSLRSTLICPFSPFTVVGWPPLVQVNFNSSFFFLSPQSGP